MFKKGLLMRLSIFLLLFSFCGFSYGQDIAAQISQYASSYAKTGDFAGCIQVTKDGATVYQACFGLANVSFGVKNKVETKFKIGSISKQITAAAILLLEQDSLLSTDDLIGPYFPDFPKAQSISIKQLLTHTSGVPDIFSIPGFGDFSCRGTSLMELCEELLRVNPDFAPGVAYQYSNGGYALLAGIIEKVSGSSYEDFLQRRIFDPLNMKDSGHASLGEVVKNLAVGYDPLGFNDLKETGLVDPELLKGSGSIYSTLEDMDIWISSLKERSFLSSPSYDKLLNNYGNAYGFGISVYRSFDREVFGHDGRINGFIADYLHYKSENQTVIILGNVQTGVADFFRRDIAAILFGEDYRTNAKTDEPAPSLTEAPEPVLGTYAFGPNFKVYIAWRDESLQARANEGSYSELVPLADGRYFSRTLYSYIEFIKGDNGQIAQLIWTNNDGNRFVGKKE
jgi:CubicO group peptidase (beta-lactamase class C family)